MTSSSGQRLSTVALIAAFFAVAGYTSAGCGLAPPRTLPARDPAPDTAKVSVIVEDSVTRAKIEGASVTLIHANHEYKAKARRSLDGTECMDDYLTIFETPRCAPMVTYRTLIRCAECGVSAGVNGKPYGNAFDVRFRVEAQGYETADVVHSLNGGSWSFVTVQLKRRDQ
jgi:hypothetical protein